MQAKLFYNQETIKRAENMLDDPITQIKKKIGGICNDYNNICKSKNGYEYFNDVLDSINPDKSQYINAAAFLLGFYVIKNNEINLNLLNSLKCDNTDDEYYMLFLDNGISKIDIVRYARFWLKLKTNQTNQFRKDDNEEEDEEQEDEDNNYYGGGDDEEEEYNEYGGDYEGEDNYGDNY